MSHQDARTTFMTGGTGFLGHYVLRELLQRGRRVVVMLRPPMADSTDRLLGLLDAIGYDARPTLTDGRLLPVEGSLPDELPEVTWGRTDEILHNAASLQLFTNGTQEPFITNVGGARSLTDWADRHTIRELHAVSTAYTCGWRSGLIREAPHEPTAGFQTDYERSKWEAESILTGWSHQPHRRLTLYRPSYLVGDSETGYTTQFAGFYQFARMVSVLADRYRDPDNGRVTHIPLRIPGRPEDPQNVVPVDFAARLIAEIVCEPRFHGRIYHLTNPDPPTNALIKRCYELHFGLEGGYFAEPGEVLGRCTPPESLLWDQSQILTPRVTHTPQFDCTHTQQVMQERGISFPALDETRIVRLLAFADAQGWGRRNGRNGKH